MDKEVNMKFNVIRMACILALCIGLSCGSVSVMAQQAGADSATATKTTDVAKVNLNSATVEQLTSLPGVGSATAKLIIEYRTQVGKFSRIEELMNVKGIGEKKFEALKNYLTL